MALTTRDDESTRRSHQTQLIREIHRGEASSAVIHPSPGRYLDLVPVAEQASQNHRQDRLGVVGELTADFCNQIRTPLASLTLYAGQLNKETPDAVRLAEKISGGINEIRRLANNMLGFAAGGRVGRQSILLVDLLADIETAYIASRSAPSSLRVCIADTTLSVSANKPALKGAILNLINNARQAGNRSTRILLHAQRHGDAIHLCVTDDGPGVADNLQARIFEPFFTTRPQGTGLGLSIVEAVAKDHDGDVSFVSSDLGSSFTLRIPLRTQEETTKGVEAT